MQPSETLRYRVSGDQNAVGVVLDSIDEVMRRRGLPPKTAYQVRLVLDEILTNIIEYGFVDIPFADVDLSLRFDGTELRVRVMDRAKPFDPTACRHAVTSGKALDRPIGGLGLFLVRNFVDELHYRREADSNVLTFRKTLIES